MAYGIDTGGGALGGAARGLQAGLSIGGGIYNEGADRALKRDQMAQEAGFRTQELGFQQKASDRADLTQGLQMRQAQREGNERTITSLATQIGVATSNKQPELAAHLQQLLDQKKQENIDLDNGSAAKVAVAGHEQKQADAAAVARGDVNILDLPGNRGSNVVAGAHGQPAIAVVDGDHHATDINPDGTNAWAQHYNTFMNHMNNGDHQSAMQAATPLISPFISAHPPGHDSHFQGLSAGDHGMQPDDPDYQHRYIAQQLDVTGRMAASNAAVNSDQGIKDMVIDAHKNGATQQQQNYFSLVKQAGGIGNLKTMAQPDAVDAAYNRNKTAAKADGASADDAHDKGVKATVAQSGKLDQDAMRDAYMKNGIPIPEDLKLPAEEKKLRGMIAHGVDPVLATKLAYSPEFAAKQMEISADAPLKKAQADYYENIKGQQTISVLGSDGVAYNRHPNGAITDMNGLPPPPGVQITAKMGTGNQNTDADDKEVLATYNQKHSAWAKHPKRYPEPTMADAIAEVGKSRNPPAATPAAAPAAPGAAGGAALPPGFVVNK